MCGTAVLASGCSATTQLRSAGGSELNLHGSALARQLALTTAPAVPRPGAASPARPCTRRPRVRVTLLHCLAQRSPALGTLLRRLHRHHRCHWRHLHLGHACVAGGVVTTTIGADTAQGAPAAEIAAAAGGEYPHYAGRISARARKSGEQWWFL